MEHKEYRLAAIMFTDIHGFSSMMEKDEAKTLSALAFHNELLRRLVAEHGGTVIKTIGDAFLADFKTTVDAVKCAVRVQEELSAYNASNSSDPIRLRIGVHLGDIHFFEDDAIGEGINIASRLQSLAKPGRICISKEVYDQVSGKINLNYISVGKAKLKNISREIYAFEIVPEGDEQVSGEQETGRAATGTKRAPSPPEAPTAPTASSDMEEIKDFILTQVKKVSRRISVKKIKEMFPGESPEIDKLLDKLVDKGYITRLENENGEVNYGAEEPHTWDEDIDPELPHHIKEKIERKVARKMDKYAYKYGYKYGNLGDGLSAGEWIEHRGRSLRNMTWEQYVAKAEKRAEKARAGFPGHIISFAFVNFGLFMINVITSFAHPWFLYVVGGWGIGVVCHLVSIRNKQRKKEETAKLPDLPKEGMLTYNRLYSVQSAVNNHLGAYVAVNGFLLLINLITSTAHFWFLYPLIAWGTGLLIHMGVSLPKIAGLKRKLKEIAGKVGGVFTGRRKKEYAEEDSLVREALSIRDAIIAEIDSYDRKTSPVDSDVKPLLIKYVDQVRDLSSKYGEIERLIDSIPMSDLEADMVKLREKSEQAKSDYMKKEYEKSIEEITRHRHSFEELNNQKEIIGLRLKSSMNNLKQLQIDLARMKSLSVSGDAASVSLLKDKTRELSQYLDDLREGYREIDEE